jgi:two-component system KDP operon response regulator KdpE
MKNEVTPMRTRILVVEDDADNLETLGLLLSTWHYDVVLADSGERAIGIAAATPVDVVLLDLGLPGLLGEEVAAILKAGISPPYIIAYTGYERLEQAAIAAGCDAFLVKPSVDKLAALLVEFDMRRAQEIVS